MGSIGGIHETKTIANAFAFSEKISMSCFGSAIVKLQKDATVIYLLP